ncbi:MAG: hypothetical protein LBI92_09540 [Azoarcus sp.]|jgi:hypothetical protein|nr:hypothetical protein [Azoarcus sp.]
MKSFRQILILSLVFPIYGAIQWIVSMIYPDPCGNGTTCGNTTVQILAISMLVLFPVLSAIFMAWAFRDYNIRWRYAVFFVVSILSTVLAAIFVIAVTILMMDVIVKHSKTFYMFFEYGGRSGGNLMPKDFLLLSLFVPAYLALTCLGVRICKAIPFLRRRGSVKTS